MWPFLFSPLLYLCWTLTTKEIQRGNLLWLPSCRHIWRWVIVPPDFFVAKPAKQAWFTFRRGPQLRTYNGYHAVNHTVRIMCKIAPNICSKSEGTITCLHTQRSIWPPPHGVNTGVKMRPNSPFKFPCLTQL